MTSLIHNLDARTDSVYLTNNFVQFAIKVNILIFSYFNSELLADKSKQ